MQKFAQEGKQSKREEEIENEQLFGEEIVFVPAESNGLSNPTNPMRDEPRGRTQGLRGGKTLNLKFYLTSQNTLSILRSWA